MFVSPAWACGGPRQPDCDFYHNVGEAAGSGGGIGVWIILGIILLIIMSKS